MREQIRKMSTKQEENRKLILHNLVEKPGLSLSVRSKQLNIAKSTIGTVISRYLATGSIARNVGSGRKLNSGNKKLVKSIDLALQRNPRLSLRDLAKKFNTSHTTVWRIKAKLGYKSHKVQKIPNRRDKQNETARKRALKLYNEILIKHKGCLIQDDETYLKCDFQQMPGQEFYSKRVGTFVDGKFRSKYVDKFAKKHLIWQAICSCGHRTPPYVKTGTLKSAEYIKECLQKKILPLYRQHIIPPVFWPDLATIHYSRDAVSWFEENQVAYVKKCHNPPNTPELRPIEHYWALLKRNIKKRSSAAFDIVSFKAKVNGAIKTIAENTVQNLMAGIKRKARMFGRGEQI